jgi:hypothetical protein
VGRDENSFQFGINTLREFASKIPSANPTIVGREVSKWSPSSSPLKSLAANPSRWQPCGTLTSFSTLLS